MTDKLITLTPEQQKDMEKMVDSWIPYALSTKPAVRNAVESVVPDLYKTINQEPPEFGTYWVKSPLEGAILQAVLLAYCPDDVKLTDEILADAIKLTEKIKKIYLVNKKDIYSVIPKDKQDIIKNALSQWPAPSIWGQFDAVWLAFYAYFLYEHKADCCERLREQMVISQSAGIWWPFDQLFIVSERPNILSVDERYRLHSSTGPALSYDDGFNIYAWHGINVDKRIIEQPETITVKEIQTEQNAEMRRILLEQFGFKRYVEQSNAKKLDYDKKYGTLWAVEVPNDETIVMVEVTNSTPEPDGTYKKYMLQVPPTMLKVRDAVAWTFGIEAGKEYEPVVET